jgi:hypothetical protein
MDDSVRRVKPLRRLHRTGPRPMALEPRIMYDGAVVDSATAAASAAAAHAIAAAMHDTTPIEHTNAPETQVPPAVEPAAS